MDVILLVSSNPTEAHRHGRPRVRRAVRQGLNSSWWTPKIDLTEGCLHLQIKPGTNVAFANGMLQRHPLPRVWRTGTSSKKRTEGFEALREIVAEYTPERVWAKSATD